MDKFDWGSINVGELEDEAEITERLHELHDLIVKDQLLDKRNSPGFSPGPAQSRSISVMSALGLKLNEISDLLLIEEPLIKKFYKRELSGASPYVNLAVARTALQMAMSGSQPEMTKFWLKTRAGWRETSSVEVTGKDGGPIELGVAKAVLLGADA